MTKKIQFENYIYNKFKLSIENWDDNICQDIYAISVFYGFNKDDVRQPYLDLSYNTEEHFKTQINEASSELEAKWNYAFWELREVVSVANFYEGDTGGIKLRDEWIKEEGLNYKNKEVKAGNKNWLKKCKKIKGGLIEICIKVVKRLHNENVIINKFKKTIPVIIHELEYGVGIVDQSKKANPEGLLDEFEKWVIEEGN